MRTRTVCGVSRGDPPINLRWLKDGEPLPSMLGANVSSLDQYSTLLNIPSLSAVHTGDYTCVASNPAAEVKYTATLKVKGIVYYDKISRILSASLDLPIEFLYHALTTFVATSPVFLSCFLDASFLINCATYIHI